MDRSSFEHCASHDRCARYRNGRRVDSRPQTGWITAASPCDDTKDAPIEPNDRGTIGTAQAKRGLGNRFENRLQLTWGFGDDRKDVAGRGLVFERFLKLTLACLLCLEQSRVLDGDDGLVGEGGNQFNLLVGERTYLGSCQSQDAHNDPIT